MFTVFASDDQFHGESTASEYGFHHIWDANGFELAITGLGIVFVALAFISLFISLLPHAMTIFEKLAPESEALPHAAASAPTTVRELDSSVVAAIGYALHTSHRGKPKT
jgi:Na+-transporting methylmalonyl-CoA/oxaloacetate decarboxylase gamma subunit